MIKVVVADDERLARSELIYLLRAHQDIRVLGEARNGLEVLEMVESHRPDVLFLDINMPGMNGLEAAKKVLQRPGNSTPPHIVFQTAYDQYAVNAFEVNAVDYLLKPIDKNRLDQSLSRVREKLSRGAAPTDLVSGTLRDLMKSLRTLPQDLSQGKATPGMPQQTKLLIRSSNRMLLISPRDLIFASMDEGRLLMVGKECEGESSFKSLEELQSALSASQFWRAHRSHLVNIEQIREIVPWFKSTYQIRMNDRKGTVIPVSRTQTRRLKELFNL